jgi:hypothetical protein
MIRACSTEIGCELKSLRLETEKNDLHGALRRVMQEEFPYGVKNLPDSHRNSTIHRRSALTASKVARSIWDATQESKSRIGPSGTRRHSVRSQNIRSCWISWRAHPMNGDRSCIITLSPTLTISLQEGKFPPARTKRSHEWSQPWGWWITRAYKPFWAQAPSPLPERPAPAPD